MKLQTEGIWLENFWDFIQLKSLLFLIEAEQKKKILKNMNKKKLFWLKYT